MDVRIKGFDLAMTADSGQCFRFNQSAPGQYALIAMNRNLTIRELEGDIFRFSCGQDEFETVWRHYFDLDRDYDAVRGLETQGESYLRRAIDFAGGVRILRQDFFETLISFIISQRKSIPAIKACVEALCVRFGERLAGGGYAFPPPEALMAASEDELTACGLGYRVRYVRRTSETVFRENMCFAGLSRLDDDSLLGELLRLPGVGVKVAQCVMLFAFQRMDAFPVDVWIKRVLDAEYPRGFPYERYRGALGILQQYLFCYARSQAGGAKRGKLVI